MALPPSERSRRHTSTRKRKDCARSVTEPSQSCKYVENRLQHVGPATRTAIAAPPACGHARRDALGIEDRNRKMKLRTLPHLAIDPDAAAMHFDQMLGNGQAASRTAGLAGARGIHAVEALENARLVDLRYADTC